MKKTAHAPVRTVVQTQRDVRRALALLRGAACPKSHVGLARYGIPADKALGVPMKVIQKIAREVGRSHELAEALWTTGIYEARLMAAYVGEPARLTPVQMERWCADFDNWAVVDTICFVLFDRTAHAWRKVGPWAKEPGEFARRAGFVLMACLAAHDETATDAQFLRLLPLIERGAGDERNFVKKGVSWALRMIGRRNARQNAAAVAVARRLAESAAPAARWVGRGALKELTSPAVQRRIGRSENE